MKKYLQITVVLTLFFLLVWVRKNFTGKDNSVSSSPTITPVINLPTTPVPVATTPSPSAPAPTTTPNASGYKDGTYTGPVTDAFYGNVQVRVKISGGSIVSVIFLQHPSDNGTSERINNDAMPRLSNQAIQAQSAQVDGVTGASATSGAFIQSLSSALAQAKA